jgi:hypothetical protein
MTPLPFNTSPLFMFLTASFQLLPLVRATRANRVLGIGVVSRGRASRAYKPRGNAPPT